VRKFYLVLAIVLAIVGVALLLSSAAFAVNKYLLGDVVTTKEQKVETDKVDTKMDADKDGIPDIKEVEEYGTNPNSADTDNDGYSDKVEIDGGYDPLTPAN